jgi:hypothetical protein
VDQSDDPDPADPLVEGLPLAEIGAQGEVQHQPDDTVPVPEEREAMELTDTVSSNWREVNTIVSGSRKNTEATATRNSFA